MKFLIWILDLSRQSIKKCVISNSKVLNKCAHLNRMWKLRWNFPKSTCAIYFEKIIHVTKDWGLISNEQFHSAASNSSNFSSNLWSYNELQILFFREEQLILMKKAKSKKQATILWLFHNISNCLPVPSILRVHMLHSVHEKCLMTSSIIKCWRSRQKEATLVDIFRPFPLLLLGEIFMIVRQNKSHSIQLANCLTILCWIIETALNLTRPNTQMFGVIHWIEKNCK